MTPRATRTLHRALVLLTAIGFTIAAIVVLTRDAGAPGWKATQQKYFALKGEGGAPQLRAVPVTWTSRRRFRVHARRAHRAAAPRRRSAHAHPRPHAL